MNTLCFSKFGFRSISSKFLMLGFDCASHYFKCTLPLTIAETKVFMNDFQNLPSKILTKWSSAVHDVKDLFHYNTREFFEIFKIWMNIHRTKTLFFTGLVNEINLGSMIV